LCATLPRINVSEERFSLASEATAFGVGETLSNVVKRAHANPAEARSRVENGAPRTDVSRVHPGGEP
jgi:hypothetical protein